MATQENKIFRLLKVLREGFSDYKWQIVLLAILSFIGGILEGIGINAIIPLFSFVIGGGNEVTDTISKAIVKFFLYFNFGHNVNYLLILIAVLFLGKAIFLFISNFLTIFIRRNYEKKTRSELLKYFLESDWSYLSKQKIGHLDQVLITDVHSSAAILMTISTLILTLANLIIYTLLVINISFLAAIAGLAFGVFAYFIFKPWGRKTRVISGESAKIEKDVAHYVNENIIGMKTVKAIFTENQVFQRGADYFHHLKNLRIKVDLFQTATNVFLQLVGIFFILALFSFFYKSNNFNFASFAIIIYAVNRVFSGIQGVQSGIYSLNSYAPNLLSILRYKEEAKQHKEEDKGKKKFNFNNQLAFQQISFSYDGKEKILSGVNFSLKNGEFVGLIGASGAGKTTIVDLFLRLLKPQEGKILLDGEDIFDISLKEWRTNIGYVSQDIFLINDTILNNIKFYNEQISDEDVSAAAKMANIYDFVQKQPNGFETMVGERGIRMSGGQRQRIVLARVLARKPQILILDEATSALDNESEIAVQKAIDSLRGKITVFAIAHRLSTIINSDHLIVLENGKVLEEGAPKELLKNEESYFSKVYNLKK